MSKPEQVLALDPPSVLRFRGPFTDVVTSDLKLTNPSERRVCFKVKTTAPKRYCVRPNSGIIEPGSSVTVAVMLQPFVYDPHEHNKHKFMVQTMFAPDGPIESQENLWKEITPEQMMDSKLRCVFEVPTEPQQNNLSTTSSEDKSAAKVTSSPEKAVRPTSAQASNMDSDPRKMGDEVKRLNAQMHQMKKDNAKLKEEGLRLRKLAVSDTVSSTPSPGSGFSTQSQGNAIPPMVYLVAALILGLIIGKFIL